MMRMRAVLIVVAAAALSCASGVQLQGVQGDALRANRSSNSSATPAAKDRTVFIIGGNSVQEGQLPYQVSIRKFSSQHNIFYGHFCGGSIVSYNYVLTAAHCAAGQSATDLFIVAGTTTLAPSSQSSRTSVSVASITVNAQYNYDPNNPDFDIALLELSQSLPLDDPNISPAPLQAVDPSDGTLCVVSGWGDTSGLDPDDPVIPNDLQEASVPFISYESCVEYYGNAVKIDQVCAGYSNGGKDACQGDSGGPLVCNGYLTGVVSWGNGCGEALNPGAYASVAYFNSWVQNNMVDSDDSTTTGPNNGGNSWRLAVLAIAASCLPHMLRLW